MQIFLKRKTKQKRYEGKWMLIVGYDTVNDKHSRCGHNWIVQIVMAFEIQESAGIRFFEFPKDIRGSMARIAMRRRYVQLLCEIYNKLRAINHHKHNTRQNDIVIFTRPTTTHALLQHIHMCFVISVAYHRPNVDRKLINVKIYYFINQFVTQWFSGWAHNDRCLIFGRHPSTAEN